MAPKKAELTEKARIIRTKLSKKKITGTRIKTDRIFNKIWYFAWISNLFFPCQKGIKRLKTLTNGKKTPAIKKEAPRTKFWWARYQIVIAKQPTELINAQQNFVLAQNQNTFSEPLATVLIKAVSIPGKAKIAKIATIERIYW